MFLKLSQLALTQSDSVWSRPISYLMGCLHLSQVLHKTSSQSTIHITCSSLRSRRMRRDSLTSSYENRHRQTWRTCPYQLSSQTPQQEPFDCGGSLSQDIGMFVCGMGNEFSKPTTSHWMTVTGTRRIPLSIFSAKNIGVCRCFVNFRGVTFLGCS